MKALIRQFPINVDEEYKEEVYYESSWHKWISKDNGEPLTGQGYQYALCQNVPVEDAVASDFDIQKIEEKSTDEMGEEVTVTKFVATFNKARYDAREKPKYP